MSLHLDPALDGMGVFLVRIVYWFRGVKTKAEGCYNMYRIYDEQKYKGE